MKDLERGLTVKISNAPSQGRCLRISLTDGAATPAESKNAGAKWCGEHSEVYCRIAGTALVVDDEDRVRSVAKQMLEMLGLTVLSAADGEEALDLYKENANSVSLVILDVSMPRMSGEETFRALRKLNDSLPVILSSGYNEQDAVRRFGAHGAAGFLQKPYRYEQLAKKVLQAAGIQAQGVKIVN